MTAKKYFVMKGMSFKEVIQGVILISTMVLLFFATGYSLLGQKGAAISAAGFLIYIVVAPLYSRRGSDFLKRGRFLMPQEAPEVYAILQDVAQKAEILPPAIFITPQGLINAYTLRQNKKPVIVLTAGLLKSLTFREMNGVLAHEIAHLIHHDGFIMNLAHNISKLTYSLSNGGMILLAIFFPLFIYLRWPLPWVGMVLLLIAPILSIVLQLALSRNREFAADNRAVSITGDPQGLAMALMKVEGKQKGLMSFFKGSQSLSILRSHPHIRRRITGLQKMQGSGKKI